MGTPSRPLAWLALSGWTLLVAGGLSSGGFSQESTGGVVRAVLLWLLPDLEPDAVEALHWWVRKGAHVFEYFVLGGLAANALRGSLPHRPRAALVLAALWVLATAGADEGRQAANPERSGKLADVALDLASGVAAIGAVGALRGRARA